MIFFSETKNILLHSSLLGMSIQLEPFWNSGYEVCGRSMWLFGCACGW